MELTNEFTVSVGLDDAWAVLTDLERIAPCMPGASLESVEGDDHHGVVKVKVGPMTATYRGTARLVERDIETHRAVVRAEGRETRGQGNASATITATLEPADDATRVRVVTDLSITGRVAQFGRGVLADVSTKLLGQFVDCLEKTVLAASAPGAAGGPEEGAAIAAARAAEGTGAGTSTGGPGEIGAEPGSGEEAATRGTALPEREAVPVNALGLVGPALVKRLAPLAAVVVLLLLLRRRRRRRAGRAEG